MIAKKYSRYILPGICFPVSLFAQSLVPCTASASAAVVSSIPSCRVSTWVYDSHWTGDTPAKGDDVDGQWVAEINKFNQQDDTGAIDQVIYYGGDLEAYCAGTGQFTPLSDRVDPYPCGANSFVTSYWGPYMGAYKLGDHKYDDSSQYTSELKKNPKIAKNPWTIAKSCSGFLDCNNGLPATPTFFDNAVMPDAVVNGSLKARHVTSGFIASQAYAQTLFGKVGSKKRVSLVVDIDGRLDVDDAGASADNRQAYIENNDYLNGLNIMSPMDARHLADFMAKTICANDLNDGVQFDLEPFCLDGSCGTLKGTVGNKDWNGQYYFYQEIAKDLAGWYGQTGHKNQYNQVGKDPLRCVDAAHPQGRFWSVFTFATRLKLDDKSKTKKIKQLFTKYNNGLVVDSLYDLSGNVDILKKTQIKDVTTTVPQPAGDYVCPSANRTAKNGLIYPSFSSLVSAEIKEMKKLNMPYQFAIPGGASTHEFESVTEAGLEQTMLKTADCDASGRQAAYITAAFQAMQDLKVSEDENYKGYAIYGWSQASWWTDTSQGSQRYVQLLPGYPKDDVLTALHDKS